MTSSCHAVQLSHHHMTSQPLKRALSITGRGGCLCGCGAKQCCSSEPLLWQPNSQSEIIPFSNGQFRAKVHGELKLLETSLLVLTHGRDSVLLPQQQLQNPQIMLCNMTTVCLLDDAVRVHLCHRETAPSCTG